MSIAERKVREKQEMRNLVLETAKQLFLEEGFGNVSIRRIAEKIEYSPATIYLYFKDKDDILYDLHNMGFEELFKRMQTVAGISDPLEQLKMVGRIYLEFALENKEYYDLMFIMHSPMQRINEEDQWNYGMQSFEFFRAIVQRCQDAGYLANTSVEVATFGLWAAVHGLACLIIRQRCPMLAQADVNGIVHEGVEMINRLVESSKKSG